MGYISMYQETEVEIYVDDIVSDLGSFNNDDLKHLKEEIEFKLNKSSNRRNENNILEASNLEEENKIEILKEFFDKFSWTELDDIKKKIM